ncbi:MAG: hypothetical protein EA397_15665 [Deltaproteobacteria bacterium]|nr:MAG: hypothetical protein EA397_15665 [Deltaproteobacteria bacterium]
MASEDAPWRDLHPASIVVNLLPRAWRVLRNFWPLALALLWRGTSEDGSVLWIGLFDVAVISLFFVLSVGGTVWHWLTLRYRVHASRLEIRTGLINRQIRTIDPARIQNVELVSNPFHRATSLVEVRIETASGSEVEGLLSALTLEEAEELRGELVRLRDAQRRQSKDETSREVLVAPGFSELLTYGATAGRIGAAVVLLGLGFEMVTWLAPERIASLSVGVFGLQGVAMGLVVITGAWLIGMATTVARHWGFTLSRGERALAVEAGLFTRRRLELPLVKVQLVMTSETLPRRWLGFGTLTVETAAARSGEGGTEHHAALAPYVPADQLPILARVAIPDLDVDPWSIELRRPHRRALARILVRRTIQLLGLTALLAWWAGPWGWLSLGLILPLGWWVAWLDHQHQGWQITPRVVIARHGYLNRRVHIVSRSRLQSVAAAQGPLLRRLGLANVVVRVAGSSVGLPIMSWGEGRALVRELADPPPRPTDHDAERALAWLDQEPGPPPEEDGPGPQPHAPVPPALEEADDG